MIKIVTTMALACVGIQVQAAVQPPALPAEPETLTASSGNEAIQNYRNAVSPTAIAAPETTPTPDWRANGVFGNPMSAVFGANYRYDSWRLLALTPTNDAKKNRDTGPHLYWIPDGNIRAYAPYPGAYAVIGPFHFRSGLTTLLRRIL